MGLTSGFSNMAPVPQNVVLSEVDAPSNYIVLDVSKEEDHEGTAEITDYPVEEGSNISDNSQPKPQIITLHAFFSSFPLAMPSNNQTPLSAYAFLKKWRAQGTQLRLITTLDVYPSVLVARVGTMRRADNTNGIECSLTLKEVFTATSLTTQAPTPSKPSINGNSSIGSKTTGAANASATENTSLLYKAVAP
jgi:hypothetical protein